MVSVVMSLFVLAPFILEPLSVETFNLATWGNVAPNIDWSVFLSTILWNYQGWDSLGCVAGEVKEGGRTYPIAITIAMILITVNYAVPVGAGIMVQPDSSQWHEGSLETIAMSIAPWLGVWVGMAAVVATLGEFNVVMACSSRALWATADYKMLPSFLVFECERFETPVAAVIFQTVTTGILMNFSFEILVVLDTFFNKLGAWAITLPKIVVLLGVLIAQKRSVWVLCGLFNVVVSSVYLVWRRFHPAHQGTCAYDRASTTIPTMYGTSLLSQPVVVNSS
uniref:Uncharacterized protein n=1 Tax=Hyaloperonospora arabidopsidis (strain Emoy2) TaxID=559515 RepID=M4B7Z9_HYAAE